MCWITSRTRRGSLNKTYAKTSEDWWVCIASQLSIGEDILEEAGNFSSLLLNACLQHLDRHQAAVVKNTLEHPHHKSLARFMTKNFLTDFQGTNGWINALQELAKIDFNMVKSVHQKEMLQISKSVWKIALWLYLLSCYIFLRHFDL